MYKLFNDEEGNLVNIITTINGKKTWIPISESNRHYQEYLEWTKASPKNVAAPADK